MEIKWQGWGKEALQRAEAENKLILLAIGASWCHWCHVMDDTTYTDPAVVEAVNRDFVPIKVDNDKRPDINDRYNQGGWPTTAFLTPDGELLAGGTYIPPEQMVQLLARVGQIFSQSGESIKAHLAARRSQMEKRIAPAGEPRLDFSSLGKVIPLLQRAYDPVHGGFGTAPKFPMVEALELLLYGYRVHPEGFSLKGEKEPELLEMLVKTLDSMSQGGIYDQVAGGFFRYSTTQDWSVPHYEKMLEDNAGLISVYLDAFRLTKDAAFRERAEDGLSYLFSTLFDQEKGAFMGSQDADEEYYKLDQEARSKRTAPKVDGTIYTNWNCLMASTLFKAWAILGDSNYLKRGLDCLSFIFEHCYDRTKGAYHYFDGQSRRLSGLARDQIALLGATLDAYQYTGNRDFLAKGEEVLSLMMANLWDEAGGGFFDIPFQEEGLTGLSQRFKNINENALAAEHLLGLSAITSKELYRSYGERTLFALANESEEYGIFAARYARVSDLFVKGQVVVEIFASPREAGLEPFILAALGPYSPRRVVKYGELSETGPVGESGVSVVICKDGACHGPFFSPDEVKRNLEEG